MYVDYNVYKFRIENGYSLQKLSDLSGVSTSQINDIENNKTHPTVLTLCKLAIPLQVDSRLLYNVHIDE